MPLKIGRNDPLALGAFLPAPLSGCTPRMPALPFQPLLQVTHLFFDLLLAVSSGKAHVIGIPISERW